MTWVPRPSDARRAERYEVFYFNSDAINENVQMYAMLRGFSLRNFLMCQMIDGPLNVGTRNGDLRVTVSLTVHESNCCNAKVSELFGIRTINGDTHNAKSHGGNPRHFRVLRNWSDEHSTG
jgi:hypothetical protein